MMDNEPPGRDKRKGLGLAAAALLFVIAAVFVGYLIYYVVAER
jgi:hypothetical protein